MMWTKAGHDEVALHGDGGGDGCANCGDERERGAEVRGREGKERPFIYVSWRIRWQRRGSVTCSAA
jgi:hypothetical protein